MLIINIYKKIGYNHKKVNIEKKKFMMKYTCMEDIVQKWSNYLYRNILHFS